MTERRARLPDVSALETGQPLIARYGDISSITLPELADNQVIGLPIRWRGELIGFFGIGAKPPRLFDDRDRMTTTSRPTRCSASSRRCRTSWPTSPCVGPVPLDGVLRREPAGR